MFCGIIGQRLTRKCVKAAVGRTVVFHILPGDRAVERLPHFLPRAVSTAL